MARTAIHPGEHLAEAHEASGVTAAQLAREIEVRPNRVIAILHGRRGITADTALRLGRCFDISAAFWMNLQHIYDPRWAEQEIGDGLSRIPKRRMGRNEAVGRSSSMRGKSKRCPAGYAEPGAYPGAVWSLRPHSHRWSIRIGNAPLPQPPGPARSWANTRA